MFQLATSRKSYGPKTYELKDVIYMGLSDWMVLHIEEA